MTALVPYKAVEVNDEKVGVEVGDILLRFPSHGHGNYVLNATKQKMLWDQSRTDERSWNRSVSVLRAHHVESITFQVDHDDRPE